MNREWSDRNKRMQALLKKETFSQGIRELTDLRGILMKEMCSWRGIIPEEDFSSMPFPGAEGYHSKTVAYSVWHIMRIEDIVVNSLILNREEILFSGDYLQKTGAPIITTGNELQKEEIAEFSRKLRIGALYDYAVAVQKATDRWLFSLRFEDIKKRFTETDRQRVEALHVVSTDENAAWLTGYWCGKDIAGLIRMPLSRHWIMHIEAAGRIIGRILKA